MVRDGGVGGMGRRPVPRHLRRPRLCQGTGRAQRMEHIHHLPHRSRGLTNLTPPFTGWGETLPGRRPVYQEVTMFRIKRVDKHPDEGGTAFASPNGWFYIGWGSNIYVFNINIGRVGFFVEANEERRMMAEVREKAKQLL